MFLLHALRITIVCSFFVTSLGAICRAPRVRREWRSITPYERASWIDAVKCLASLPRDPKVSPTVDPGLSLIPPMTPDSSRFDDFSYSHMDHVVLIHNTGFFFPWHRQFLQTFEDELRTKCGYDGVQPYWDWTQDAADFHHATIFNSSTYDGLGTWGDQNNDFQILDGAFKDIRVAYPVPHKIRREYTNQPFLAGAPPPSAPPVASLSLMMNTTFTREFIHSIIKSFTGDFLNFQQTVENIPGPHTGVHSIVGGDMAGTCPYGLTPPACYPLRGWSPNDPMFYLHHAMIDKVWYDWQLQDSRNRDAFSGGTVSWRVDATQSFAQYPTGSPPWIDGGSVVPNDGLWDDEVMVSEVMSTVGGRLCYVYA